MKFVDEFRNPKLARSLSRAIAQVSDPGRTYRLMEFCGGHTHLFYRHGLQNLLPENVRMIHGPGCPVCVLPSGRLQGAIDLATQPDLILCSYGDMMRVPTGEGMTLARARAQGADVRMVYSPLECLAIARDNPHKSVVFFAVGFETTAPATAVTLWKARTKRLKNFFVYCNHVLTPPVMATVLSDTEIVIDGVVAPGHVAAVIGSGGFEKIATATGRPLAVCGFEPLDLLQSIYYLLVMCNEGKSVVKNQYSRVVSFSGSEQAQEMLAKVFAQAGSFRWRGLGDIPSSALALNGEFAGYDAVQRFGLALTEVWDHKACICSSVLTGKAQPQQCKVFATACTPEHPLGSCMVSSEGACAACYRYARHEQEVTV